MTFCANDLDLVALHYSLLTKPSLIMMKKGYRSTPFVLGKLPSLPIVILVLNFFLALSLSDLRP